MSLATDKSFKIAFFPEAAREYRKLDGSQRIFVDKGLARLQQLGMAAGQALKGELSHYRKLKNKRLGLRIIFTQEADQLTIIEIVAIGRREDAQVYHQATQRLHNPRH